MPRKKGGKRTAASKPQKKKTTSTTAKKSSPQVEKARRNANKRSIAKAVVKSQQTSALVGVLSGAGLGLLKKKTAENPNAWYSLNKLPGKVEPAVVGAGAALAVGVAAKYAKMDTAEQYATYIASSMGTLAAYHWARYGTYELAGADVLPAGALPAMPENASAVRLVPEVVPAPDYFQDNVLADIEPQADMTPEELDDEDEDELEGVVEDALVVD